jgi:FMN reductase
MTARNIETVLGLSGSITDGSKTETAVEQALAGAAAHGVDTELVHLGDYDIVEADGRSLDAYEGDTAAVLDAIVDADAYVIGSPVYRASYSGVLKNLFDMIPRGMWQADVAPLESAAVGLVATGATPHHYLMVDQELRPVMGFFGACTVGGVYAHGDQFEDGAIVDDDITGRLTSLGGAVVDVGEALATSDSMAALGPQF